MPNMHTHCAASQEQPDNQIARTYLNQCNSPSDIRRTVGASVVAFHYSPEKKYDSSFIRVAIIWNIAYILIAIGLKK